MMHSADVLLKLKHRCPYLSTAGLAEEPSAEEVGKDLCFDGPGCFLATTLGVGDFSTGKNLFPLCVGLGGALYCCSQSRCQVLLFPWK